MDINEFIEALRVRGYVVDLVTEYDEHTSLMSYKGKELLVIDYTEATLDNVEAWLEGQNEG